MGVTCTRQTRCIQTPCHSAGARAKGPPDVDATPGSTSSLEVVGPDAGLCNSCFEPVGAQTSEHWVHVGPGRGGYEKIARFNFVGTGSGRYNKNAPNQSSCRVLRVCCTALVFGAGFASFYML